MSTGGFAPTSLFGIVTVTTARQAGIDLNPLTLLAAAIVANLALLVVAAWMFPGPSIATAPRNSAIEPAATGARSRFASHQIVTLICIVGLILSVDHRFLAGIPAGSRRDRIRVGRRTRTDVPGGGG